jgi:hypothetical protein
MPLYVIGNAEMPFGNMDRKDAPDPEPPGLRAQTRSLRNLEQTAIALITNCSLDRNMRRQACRFAEGDAPSGLGVKEPGGCILSEYGILFGIGNGIR